ncbi:MAG: response regulator transcription factor [Tannerellaceae bacterium]
MSELIFELSEVVCSDEYRLTKFQKEELIRRFILISKLSNTPSYLIDRYGEQIFCLSQSFLDLIGYSKSDAHISQAKILNETIAGGHAQFLQKAHIASITNDIWSKNKNNRSNLCIQYQYNLCNKNKAEIPIVATIIPSEFTSKGRPSLFYGIIHKFPNPITEPRVIMHYLNDDKVYEYNEVANKFEYIGHTDLKEIEVEILRHIAQGTREYNIAAKLDLDINLVKYYKKSIMKKLNAPNMPSAVFTALQQNIL